MFAWVMCLVAITLGVKVSAPAIAAVLATPHQSLAPIISFLMGAAWYLTFLVVVLGVSKKFWLERLANSKRRAN